MDLLQSGFTARYRKAIAAKPLGKTSGSGGFYLNGTDPKNRQSG